MIRASIGVLAIARVASAEPPFRIGAEPWVGAELRHRFGETLVEGLALDLVPSAIDARAMIEVSISHTVASYRGRATDPYGVVAPLSYALEQRELIVGAVALRRFTDEEGRLIPLLGGGPLIAHLHNREAIATTTQTMFGLEGIAGVDVRLGPGFVGLSFRALVAGQAPNCVRIRGTCGNVPALSGATTDNSFTTLAGYRFVY